MSEKLSEQPEHGKTSEPSGLTRRRFLKAGVGAVTSLSVPALAGCDPGEQATAPAVDTAAPTIDVPISSERMAPLRQGIPLGEPLRQPMTLASQNGLLNTSLTVAFHEYDKVPVLTEDAQKKKSIMLKNLSLRTYGAADPNNGNQLVWDFPGPTLRLRPKDLIALNLINDINNPSPTPTSADGCDEGSPAGDVSPNCYHGDDVTNIHYHGSHVDPNAPGDDVFLQVYPKNASDSDHPAGDPNVIHGEFAYQFGFPESQIPGTHWYHAHKHGSTALQMLNGLAGAMIIDGDFEGIPEIANAKEYILIIQQIQDELNLLVSDEHGSHPPAALSFINGQLAPKITMRPGEVQRWRFISATMQASATIASIKFENDQEQVVADPMLRPQMYQIAADGIEFLDRQWQNVRQNPEPFLDVPLAPGNRADYLVKAPGRRGMHMAIPQQEGVLADRARPEAQAAPPFKGPPLFIVEVTGEPMDMPLPQHLRTFEQLPPALQRVLAPIDQAPVDRTRRITFYMAPGQGQMPQFYIDCKKFCADRVDHCMALGTTEEWKIENWSSPQHPFHIHVNPFFVTQYFDPNTSQPNATLPPDDPRRRWQDVIALPPARLNGDGSVAEPGYVVIRQRFLDFTGEFVIHCHILGHEDRGMMQRIQVIDGTIEECMALECAPMPEDCEAPDQDCLKITGQTSDCP